MGASFSIFLGILTAPVVMPASYYSFRNNEFMNKYKVYILVIALIVLTLMLNDPNSSLGESGMNKYGKPEPQYIYDVSMLSVITILVSLTLVIFVRK